ncbi:MAG: diguanylate cyclase, partial [Firmicutes bacterium]|nr:diguanylate cyclase [Bacillota bacterium]
ASPVGHDTNLVLSIVRDVTESTETEERLLRQNAQLRRAEMITGLGSWELYLPLGTFTLSDGGMEVLGRKDRTHAVADADEVVMPEYRELRKQALDDLIYSGKPYDIQFQAKRPADGEVVYIHSIAEYDAETKTVFGTLLDITAWKNSQAVLQASKRRNNFWYAALAFTQLIVILLLVANVVGRRQSESELKQNLNRNESLLRILQYEADSVQEFIDYALHESIKLTESGIGYIYFYDDDTHKLTLNAWSEGVLGDCHIKDKETVYDLHKTGIWGEPIRTGRPVIVDDFTKDHPLKKGYPEGHVPIKSYMALPIVDRGKIVATIGLANKAGPYTQMDVWQITMLMSSVWSMLERRRGEIALRTERKRLEAILLSVGDGVITTDDTGKIEFINQVAEELTGWAKAEAIGRPFEDVYYTVNEETLEKQIDSVHRVLRSGIARDLMNHTILMTKDGKTRHIADSAAPIKDDTGRVNGAVLVFRDVTEELARTKEIEYLSFHDQLTALYNRRFVERALETLDQESNLPLSIIMADLNNLKLINDTLGHATGDQMLKTAASVIKEHCQDDLDIIARWGGDEFIVLLPKAGCKKAEAIITKIEETLKERPVESVLVSMAFGHACKYSQDKAVSEVFKEAENRMYRAKILQGPGIHEETIDALMAALFEKNRREEAHSQRVSELSQLIGLALGLSDVEVKELGLIGLFHDIGKIAVDESILNKATPLTEDEWQELLRHPEVGYRLLSAVQGMEDIAESVLAHHERWDGTGYPKGLKGAEIPLESRIVGIADAYDAMVSYRPYKRALTKVEAIEELKNNAGTQFDPYIVSAFVDVLMCQPD